MLAKRAKLIFGRVNEALNLVGLASPVGAEYASVLRTHLLASPEYCAASAPATFHGEARVSPRAPPAALIRLQPCQLYPGSDLASPSSTLRSLPLQTC